MGGGKEKSLWKLYFWRQMKQERDRLKSIEEDEKMKNDFREKEDKAWEDVRDSRVNSWRSFTSPSGGAKKKQKKVSKKRG